MHKSNIQHITWLKTRAASLNRPVCQIDIEMLLAQYTSLTESIEKLDGAIVYIAEEPHYKKAKDALNSFLPLVQCQNHIFSWVGPLIRVQFTCTEALLRPYL